MQSFVELRQIGTVIVRRGWLLIVFALLAGGIGYKVSQLQKPVYEATTSLMVGQSIQAAELDRYDIQVSGQLALSYADIAMRKPVLQEVVDTLHLKDSWQALRKRVRVVPVENTQLLEITVDADSPETAETTANEIAYQLIHSSPSGQVQQSDQVSQAFVQSRLASLRAKIEAGQRKLEAWEAIRTVISPGARMDATQKEINSLEQLMANWEGNYTHWLSLVTNKLPTNALSVVEPAQANPNPVRPRTNLNTLISMLVGFVLAVGLIFLLEYLDDSIKLTDDLNELLGLPCLGMIGQIKGKRTASKLIAPQNLFSPVAEEYRLLRSSIQFLAVDGPKAILVTSTNTGEGTSTTAANLGAALARAGLQTIIVDANLRTPTQHTIFQIPGAKGLADLLRSSQLEVEPYLREIYRIANLRVLASGVVAPSAVEGLSGNLATAPTELLGSKRMKELLAQLMKLADIVIIDSPPAASLADASMLSHWTDGVLFVIEASCTSRPSAKAAILNLQQAQAHLLGAVFNQVSQQMRIRTELKPMLQPMIPGSTVGAPEPTSS